MDKPSKPTGPHPVLAEYYKDQVQRPLFVRGLFDRTAGHYDRINRIFSLGTGNWYRHRALVRAGLQHGMAVLDVATGTGLVARQALAVVGGERNVVGLDVSAGMLLEARRALNIHAIQGTAEQLPIADASVDFVTLGYALRHVANLDSTFREFRRVLRPQGTVLILEISKPANRLRYAFLNFYLGCLIPCLSRWVTGEKEAHTLMRYYWDTIDQCVPPETILQALTAAGFAQVRCDVEFGIMRAYIGRKA